MGHAEGCYPLLWIICIAHVDHALGALLHPVCVGGHRFQQGKGLASVTKAQSPKHPGSGEVAKNGERVVGRQAYGATRLGKGDANGCRRRGMGRYSKLGGALTSIARQLDGPRHL